MTIDNLTIKEKENAMDMKEFDTLYEKCKNCDKCELAKTRTNVVFGTGNPEKGIMFVGEGPGENEDLQGEPFVGRAGQLLNLMLDAVDLSREKDVYITNIVKCRPPHNRDPFETESEQCINYLRMQTRIIKPKIIVCLGRIAAIRLIKPDFKVTKEHGKWFHKGGIWFMGTYHPAALLRNVANKPDAMEDLLSLKEKMAELQIQD